MQIEIEKHLDKLGYKAQDKVTGFVGIITSVSFDLYGCVQALIHPGIDKEDKLMTQTWFDIGRLDILSSLPRMDKPDYLWGPIAQGEKGPATKPLNGKA